MASLAAVTDINCLVSKNPLAFDMGTTLVRGAQAVLRRVLYIWCSYLGTLRYAPDLGILTPIQDLQASTFSARNLAGLQATLETQAKLCDFVDRCDVTISLTDAGAMVISSTVTLTDNKAYALEVSVTGARAVLLAKGSLT